MLFSDSDKSGDAFEDGQGDNEEDDEEEEEESGGQQMLTSRGGRKGIFRAEKAVTVLLKGLFRAPDTSDVMERGAAVAAAGKKRKRKLQAEVNPRRGGECWHTR